MPDKSCEYRVEFKCADCAREWSDCVVNDVAHHLDDLVTAIKHLAYQGCPTCSAGIDKVRVESVYRRGE